MLKCSKEMQNFPKFPQNPISDVCEIVTGTLTNELTKFPKGWPVQFENDYMQ